MTGSVQQTACEVGVAAMDEIRILIGFYPGKGNFSHGVQRLLKTVPHGAADQVAPDDANFRPRAFLFQVFDGFAEQKQQVFVGFGRVVAGMHQVPAAGKLTIILFAFDNVCVFAVGILRVVVVNQAYFESAGSGFLFFFTSFGEFFAVKAGQVESEVFFLPADFENAENFKLFPEVGNNLFFHKTAVLPDDKQVKFLLHFQIVPGNKLLMQYNVFRLF